MGLQWIPAACQLECDLGGTQFGHKDDKNGVTSMFQFNKKNLASQGHNSLSFLFSIVESSVFTSSYYLTFPFKKIGCAAANPRLLC